MNVMKRKGCCSRNVDKIMATYKQIL